MSMAAILVMWPGPFIQTLVPLPKDAPYKVWLSLAQGFQRRRSLKSVNDDEGRRSMGIL